METVTKNFELQIDEKPNGVVIRLNDGFKCVLRICGIPKNIVFDGKKIKEFIDITIPESKQWVKK